MSLENYEIKFNGFDPNRKVKKVAKKAIESLQNIAPYKSYVKMYIDKLDNGYKGEINVSSISGKWSFECSGSCEKKIIKNLTKKIKLQLDSWKTSRTISSKKLFGGSYEYEWV